MSFLRGFSEIIADGKECGSVFIDELLAVPTPSEKGTRYGKGEKIDVKEKMVEFFYPVGIFTKLFVTAGMQLAVEADLY